MIRAWNYRLRFEDGKSGEQVAKERGLKEEMSGEDIADVWESVKKCGL